MTTPAYNNHTHLGPNSPKIRPPLYNGQNFIPQKGDSTGIYICI